MYKIGIFGHGPDRFKDQEKIRRLIGQTIGLLQYQYGDNVVFNIEASVGVGLWCAEECFEKSIRFHLFLPYQIQHTCDHWYDHQSESMKRCYNTARSLTICNQDVNGKEEPYKSLVEQSNFMVFFWVGSKQGKTASAVRHAFKHNVLAVNACDNLKLITKDDLKKSRFVQSISKKF